MTDPRPASERAADLRARILAVVEAGFALEPSTFFLYATERGPCGCAVGAAAYALGLDAPLPGEESFAACVRAIGSVAHGDEIDDLEGGFERCGGSGEGPFYALGVELRSLADKAAPATPEPRP